MNYYYPIHFGGVSWYDRGIADRLRKGPSNNESRMINTHSIARKSIPFYFTGQRGLLKFKDHLDSKSKIF